MILVLTSLLLVLVLDEVVIRISSNFVPKYDIEMTRHATLLKVTSLDQDQGYYHGKNAKAHLMGVDIVTNSLGLRDIFGKDNCLVYYKKLYKDSNLGWARCKGAMWELYNFCMKKKVLDDFYPGVS